MNVLRRKTGGNIPILRTRRLVLRSFSLDDAPEVERLAGAREVAATTSLPHPYPEGAAQEWIGTHGPGFDRGELLCLAVTHAAKVHCWGR